MAGGTSTNLGGQQVTLFPYQPLSSAQGNELLHGVLVPGVSNIQVSVTSDSTNVYFNILPGSQLTFLRQATDGTGPQLFLGKVVLTSTATMTFQRSQLWSTNTFLVNTKALYLVADWTYDATQSTTIYAQFTLETDSTIQTIRNNDETSSHQLILATILNQQYFVSLVGGGMTLSSLSVSNYHISYDAQNQRSPLPRLFNINQDFNVDFDPNGRGVYVENGQVMVNGTLVNYAPVFDTTSTGSGKTYPLRSASSANTGLIPPPVGLLVYTNPATNTQIYIAGSETSYYQIDFLRVKSDDVTHVTAVYWESFLRPAPTVGGITWVGGTPITLDFDGYSTTNMTQTNLLGYLSALPAPYNQFQLAGEGQTLLISIRLRGASTAWQGVPTVDGVSNKTWPENCINMKAHAIPSLGMAPAHKRFKLPIWQSSDIGL